MPRVADYVIITGGKAKLQLVGAGGAKFWSFAAPSNIHLGSRSVLSFHLERLKGALNLEWAVFINNKEVFNFKYTGNTFFANAIQKVVPANLFKLSTSSNSKPNTIMFMKKKGAGIVEFSDVVIWIQANV